MRAFFSFRGCFPFFGSSRCNGQTPSTNKLAQIFCICHMDLCVCVLSFTVTSHIVRARIQKKQHQHRNTKEMEWNGME